MGCGASRLGAEGQAIPARFQPLLRGRIDNIRKRKNAASLQDDHGSKKELLLHGREEDDHSQSLEQSTRKSVASYDEKEIIVHEECQKREPERTIKKTTTTNDGLTKEGSAAINGKEKGEDKKVINIAEKKEAEEESEKVRRGEEEEEEGGEEEDDEGYDSYEEGEQIGVGDSPSFRVYFTDNLENEKDDLLFSNASRDAGLNNKSETSPKECLQNNEKKGGKRKNFRKVLPGGGKVKKLLNVRSCYTKKS